MKTVTTELFGRYGCYLENCDQKLVVTHPADWTKEQLDEAVTMEYLYPSARENVEGWDGMHGFEGEEDEDEETYNERMEDAAEYYCEPWNEEEHAPHCTYGGDTEPATVELELF